MEKSIWLLRVYFFGQKYSSSSVSSVHSRSCDLVEKAGNQRKRVIRVGATDSSVEEEVVLEVQKSGGE